MNQAQTALQIIALIETVEPSLQAGVLALVNLWKSGGDVNGILQGEITALGQIAAKARIAQGLPAVAAPVDTDPVPAAA